MRGRERKLSPILSATIRHQSGRVTKYPRAKTRLEGAAYSHRVCGFIQLSAEAVRKEVSVERLPEANWWCIVGDVPDGKLDYREKLRLQMHTLKEQLPHCDPAT